MAFVPSSFLGSSVASRTSTQFPIPNATPRRPSSKSNKFNRNVTNDINEPTTSMTSAVLVASAKSEKKVSISKFDRMRAKFALPSAQLEKSGFSYEDFDAAMSEFDYKFEDGDICTGRVYEYERNGVLVDIGAKASAFCSNNELSMAPVGRAEEILELGEDREFQIISKEDANGQLRLSIRRMEYARAWERVNQLQAEDVIVRAEVTAVNRGGCMVMIEGLRAFLPGSHMSLRTPREDLIGVELPLKFLEVSAEKGRLVVSNRRAVVERQMMELNAGQLIEGTVSGIKPYGAFVDIGGVSGLLHVSQISHDHVGDISAVVKDGSTVKCMVISQDKEKGRISLSTKTLEPEPGDMIRDPQLVYDKAEEMAERYHARLEEERKAAADVADDIVSTLDMASLDDLGVDPPVPSES